MSRNLQPPSETTGSCSSPEPPMQTSPPSKEPVSGPAAGFHATPFTTTVTKEENCMNASIPAGPSPQSWYKGPDQDKRHSPNCQGATHSTGSRINSMLCMQTIGAEIHPLCASHASIPPTVHHNPVTVPAFLSLCRTFLPEHYPMQQSYCTPPSASPS